MSMLTELLFPESVTAELPEGILAYLSVITAVMVAYVAATALLAIVINWRLFKKGGYCGILSLIPIVNAFLFTKILFGRAWILFLYLIPVVGQVLMLITPFRFARVFGRGFFFGIGTLLFPSLFYAVAALGGLEYEGPHSR